MFHLFNPSYWRMKEEKKDLEKDQVMENLQNEIDLLSIELFVNDWHTDKKIKTLEKIKNYMLQLKLNSHISNQVSLKLYSYKFKLDSNSNLTYTHLGK